MRCASRSAASADARITERPVLAVYPWAALLLVRLFRPVDGVPSEEPCVTPGPIVALCHTERYR